MFINILLNNIKECSYITENDHKIIAIFYRFEKNVNVEGNMQGLRQSNSNEE